MKVMENKTIEASKKKKNSRLGELLRFVVIGVLCTIIDFVIEYLLGLALANNIAQLGSTTINGNVTTGYGSYLSLAICVLVGFIVSMIVNFFFSRKWVFQDVDKNTNFNTPKYFWTYAGFAFGGLLLGIGIQCLCCFGVNQIWGLNLSVDPFQKVDWMNLFKKDSISFWAFAIVFCIKTLITLIYNYTTRKLFIFKKPKPSEIVEKASASINDKVIADHYTNEPVSFSEIAPINKEKDEKVVIADAKADIDAKEDIVESKPVEVKPAIEFPKEILETEPSKITTKAEVKPEPQVEETVVQPKKVITPSNDSVDTVYGKTQFNWGNKLTKKNATDLIYSALEIYDKRKTPVASKKRIKEIIVETILEEEKKRK